MARPEVSDVLQSFRFHVVSENNNIEYSDNQRGQAGFQSVTLPELSVEPVEYREGHHTYTQKYPGVPTVTDVTMIRGVTKRDTAFYRWVKAAAEGGEYRTNLTVYHFPRDAKRSPDKVADLSKARLYNLYECVPTRVKFAGDLDATSGEVSMAEVDVAVEYFDLDVAGT